MKGPQFLIKSTPEDLELRWSHVLRYGDKILVAGHYYSGPGVPSWYGAVYEFLSDDTSCEGEVGLYGVGPGGFTDEGHAIAWAISIA